MSSQPQKLSNIHVFQSLKVSLAAVSVPTKRSGAKEFLVSVSLALVMSAKILNLLSEEKDGKAPEMLPPPGLEKSPGAAGQEHVEDACLSSGSTRDEDGFEEQNIYQDWDFGQNGQSFYFDSQPEGAILSTTPLCPPALVTPSVAPAWEWPTDVYEYVEPYHYDLQLGDLQATLGSAGHDLGNCKPCAFVYTKGCQSGVSAAQFFKKKHMHM